MTENVRSAIASENVRFAIAAFIALVLIGSSYVVSSDPAGQSYSEASTSPSIDLNAPAADVKYFPKH